MTWSQGVFGYCGLVLTGASAVLSGLKAVKRGRSFIIGLICGGGSVVATLAVMSVVAVALFPTYPNTPTSEPLGISLTLPCVLAGAFAFRFISGWETCSKQALRRSWLILTATWVMGVLLSYQLMTWPYRKALPWSASEVRDYAWEEGFLPDYKYFLCAAITEQQFHAYIAKFKLTSSGKKTWWGDDRASWFMPNPGLHEVYGLTEGSWSMTAFYDAGHIFVIATLQ